MTVEVQLHEYLDQIRQEVCSQCVERPPGGPPCGPLGKPCGVELHLPHLVEAVQQVQSELVDPYLNANRREVCQCCPFTYSAYCPCPMDSLAVLVVQAIEKVDERHALVKGECKAATSRPDFDRPEIEDVFRACAQSDLEEIIAAHEAAVGTWTHCDWPAVFGANCLNLEGCTVAQAEARAATSSGEEKVQWEAAARWLKEVERRAAEAQDMAAKALAAARAGAWGTAAEYAQWAWSLEFATGRPFRRQATTWKRLYQLLAAAAWLDRESAVIDTTRMELPTL